MLMHCSLISFSSLEQVQHSHCFPSDLCQECCIYRPGPEEIGENPRTESTKLEVNFVGRFKITLERVKCSHVDRHNNVIQQNCYV